jgi:pimeloyl-ACP methyl ester carboxylesterase
MSHRKTLVLALFVLATACSGPDIPQQTNAGIEVPEIPTGPITVLAPDGIEIAATVHSIGRPSVILVHDWMCDQTYWDNQVPALAEHFGVVTVDVAGHGHFLMQVAPEELNSALIEIIAALEKGITPQISG